MVNANLNMATDAALSRVQNTVIKMGRFVEQHSRPMWGLMESFTLGKGNKQLDIPTYNEFEAHDVTPGIELVQGEAISPSIVSATVSRVALKVILLRDLTDQYNEDLFNIVGRLSGEAFGVKEDRDALALISGFSTQLGGDNKNLSLANANGLVAYSQSGNTNTDGRRFGPANNTFVVHHPNAIAYLRSSLANTGATYPIPSLKGWDVLKDYWGRFDISGVQFFSDSNIQKIAGTDSGWGGIFNRSALGILKGQEKRPYREYLSGLFADQITWSERYGAFELDDSRGAAARYEIGALATDA